MAGNGDWLGCKGWCCQGVVTSIGLEIPARSVVLTNGTFLNGLIHIGEKQLGGGRAGEKASTGITEQLESLGFESGRMKTGTPPRIDGRSWIILRWKCNLEMKILKNFHIPIHLN